MTEQEQKDFELGCILALPIDVTDEKKNATNFLVKNLFEPLTLPTNKKKLFNFKAMILQDVYKNIPEIWKAYVPVVGLDIITELFDKRVISNIAISLEQFAKDNDFKQVASWLRNHYIKPYEELKASGNITGIDSEFNSETIKYNSHTFNLIALDRELMQATVNASMQLLK